MRKPLIAMCATMLLLTSAVDAQIGNVHWADDRLTVQSVNAPLKELVEEVARRTGIVVTGADRLAGRRSVDFRDTRLPEAVRILLEEVNYIVTTEQGVFHIRIHSMSGAAAHVLFTGPVHIPGLTDRTLGQNAGLDDVDVDVDEDEDQQEELDTLAEMAGVEGPEAIEAMAEAMQSEFVDVRTRALELLARRKDPEALPLIVAALADDDLDVALTASNVLAAMPGMAVLDTIMGQLQQSEDADVQFMALRALALRADPASLLQVRRAAQEAHPLVRDYAAALLKELEARAKAAAAPKR